MFPNSNYLQKSPKATKNFGRFLFDWVLRQKWVVLLQEFVYLNTTICPHFFSVYNDARSVVEGPHIHISSVIFVISMMLMDVFVCPYSFLSITVVVPLHFYYFIFFFKFYYSIVDIIVNHLYLLFLRSRKTNTKCCDRQKQPPEVFFKKGFL